MDDKNNNILDIENEPEVIEQAQQAASNAAPSVRASTPQFKPKYSISEKNANRDFLGAPFRYDFQQNEDISLNSGALEYFATDFVLPGKNGFDLVVKRTYNSTEANINNLTVGIKESKANLYYFGLFRYNKPSRKTDYFPVFDENPDLIGGPYITSERRSFEARKARDWLAFDLWGEDGHDEFESGDDDGDFMVTVTLEVIGNGNAWRENTRPFYTVTESNNHKLQNHLLGHGWSFNFPSVEKIRSGYNLNDADKPKETFSYYLHLGDGRSYEIKDNKLKEHPLEDFIFATEKDNIQMPDGSQQEYRYIVSFDDGKRYYIGETNIVCMEDRHGNRIYFTFNSTGITIVDTLNRTISLNRTQGSGSNYNMAWTLPEGKSVSYSVVNNELRSATNQIGDTTAYSYTDYRAGGRLFFEFSGDNGIKSDDGNAVIYKLLTQVDHPTGAKTKYSYTKHTQWHPDDNGYLFRDVYVVGSRRDEEAVDNQLFTRNLLSYDFYYDYTGESTGEDFERNTPIYSYYICKATVTDTNRNTREEHVFDSRHLRESMQLFHPTSELSPKQKKEYIYNSNKLPVSEAITSYDGAQSTVSTTLWAYDKRGNKTKITNPLGYETDMEYHYFTSPRFYSLPKLKKYKRDASAEITEVYAITSNDRDIGSVSISENGQLRQSTELTYHANGNLHTESVKDAGGNRHRLTTYIYQNDVFVKQKTVLGATGSVFTLELLEYDAYGNITKRTDPNGHITEYVYDNLGRVTEEIFRQSSGNTRRLTAYSTNPNRVTTTDEAGNKKQLDYTPLGKIKTVAALLPQTTLTTYTYDNLERLHRETVQNANGTAKAVTEYTYDYFDRATAKWTKDAATNTELHRETVTYNDVSMTETKTTDGGGNTNAPSITATATMDKLGRMVREATGSAAASYIYDYLGNKQLAITDYDQSRGLLYSGYWTYDYANRVVREFSAKNSGGTDRCTEIIYDVLGNKKEFRDFGNTGANHKTSYFTYDALDRLLEQQLPFEGATRAATQYTYDGVGNILWEKLKRGSNEWSEKEHRYDERNRLTETIQYVNTARTSYIKTRFFYDAVGNKTAMHTGLTENSANTPAITTYTYNRFGNMLTMTDPRSNILPAADPLRRVEAYEYDNTGRLLAKTDRNKNRTAYSYDALDRITEERVTAQNPTGAFETVRTFGYTKTGQKATEAQREAAPGKSPETMTTSYVYDNMGRLTGQTDPGNLQKTNTYDPNGNRTRALIKRGNETITDLYYEYDGLNRLLHVRKGSAAAAPIAAYAYNLSGNRESLTHPNGVSVTYTYNDGNLVKTLVNKLNGVSRSAFTYSYTPDGNQISKTTTINSTSPVTTTYSYDRLGRLTAENESGGTKLEYLYDRFSNRTKMTETDNRSRVTTTTYHYNNNNWLQREEKQGTEITDIFYYRYDANGNQASRRWERLAPRGYATQRRMGFAKDDFPLEVVALDLRQYNGFNQLVTVEQDSEITSYSYRPDGLRHSKTSKANTVTHYWDGQNIIAEANANGNIRGKYLRGVNLVAQEIDNQSWYYTHNAHGDVVQRIRDNGEAAPVYHYDAFGNERNPVDTDPNPFRYCGEYWDKETESYYLRARCYVPRNGRFTQEDPIGSGLNWYTYCYSNPVLLVDPTGCVAYTQSYNAVGGIYYKFKVETRKDTATYLAFGNIPLLGTGIDLTRSLANNFSGMKEIGSSIASDFGSKLVAIADDMNLGSLFKGSAKGVSKFIGQVNLLITAKDISNFIMDQHVDALDQIIENQFYNEMLSSSRELVEYKYLFAQSALQRLYDKGELTYITDKIGDISSYYFDDSYKDEIANLLGSLEGMNNREIEDLYLDYIGKKQYR